MTTWLPRITAVVLITLGALISAVAVIVFQAPFRIAPAGVTGLAVILNNLIGTPIGLVILLGNIPIQYLAYRTLGGWRVIAATIFYVVLYSALIDVLTPLLPPQGVSDNVLLNALFGGIVGGIGVGLVFRGGGTAGGTSTLGRILQEKYGIPLSTSTLYTDGIVVAIAGLAFGWEGALYAIVALYVGGATTDYTLEGPSVIRTAIIVTDQAESVAGVVMTELGRGVTSWNATGMYTGAPHTVLYVTVNRAQVNALRRAVLKADPKAFLVIGHGHVAYGKGFKE